MPLPFAIWIFWCAVLGLPEWLPRDTRDDQKSG